MPMTANELNTIRNLTTLTTRWKDASFSIAASNGNLYLDCSRRLSCSSSFECLCGEGVMSVSGFLAVHDP